MTPRFSRSYELNDLMTLWTPRCTCRLTAERERSRPVALLKACCPPAQAPAASPSTRRQPPAVISKRGCTEASCLLSFALQPNAGYKNAAPRRTGQTRALMTLFKGGSLNSTINFWRKKAFQSLVSPQNKPLRNRSPNWGCTSPGNQVKGKRHLLLLLAP